MFYYTLLFWRNNFDCCWKLGLISLAAAAIYRGLLQALVRSAIYFFPMADFNHPYRKLVILDRIYDPIIPLTDSV